MTAILEITDGTQETAINLINSAEGIHLQEWIRRVSQYKPIVQENEMQDGSQVVHRKFPLVDEVFTFDVDGNCQDDIIALVSRLTRDLEDAVDFWINLLQTRMIYIRARANAESNEQYALVHGYSLPNLWNPYSSPFTDESPAALDLKLTLSRDHWRGQPPGVGECLYRNTLSEWRPRQEWLQATGSPSDQVYSFGEAANGYLLAGEVGAIWRSTDGGLTWSQVSTVPTGEVYEIVLLDSDTLLAADNANIYRSIDNGGTWSTVYSSLTNPTEHITQIGSGRVFVGTQDQMVYSDDDGQSWTAVGVPIIQSGLVVQIGNILYNFNFDGAYNISDDGGTTWSADVDTNFTTDNLGLLLDLKYDQASGYVYGLGITVGSSPVGIVYRFDFSESRWELLAWGGILEGSIERLLLASDGRFYLTNRISGQPVVLVSADGGFTWTVDYTAADVFWPLFESSAGKIFVGDYQKIWYKDISSFEVGAERSCSVIHYVANKHTRANLTHIKYWDDSLAAFTTVTYPMTSFPGQFSPTSVASGDIIYFGCQSSIIDSGPICSLAFDIYQDLAFSTATSVLEYWTGSAWTALTYYDDTAAAGTAALTRRGVHSMHWLQPADWIANAVDGVTAFWVRLRFTSTIGGTARQQNRQIYAITTPFVDIAADDVLGEIPALLQVRAINRSDADGPGGSGPNLYANRLLMASRSLAKGERFTPYINLADEQNELDMSITLGTNTSFEIDSEAPTGRRIHYNPAGSEAMADRVTIEFGPGLTGQYYGNFHVYLVGQRVGGSATDISVRLQFVSGSGGIVYTIESKNLATTTAFEALDFGQITLPVTGQILPGEIADLTQIIIQASAASGTPDLYLYELILFPVDDDEWSIDVQDRSNTTASDVGRSGGNGKLLDVDSISDPREVVRCLVRFEEGPGVITANYAPVSKSRAFVNERRDQRIWFLAMQTDATGSSNPTWIARPEISFLVDLYKSEGYLTMRGNG